MIKANKVKSKKHHMLSDQFQLQSMILPGIVFLAVFAYIPMYGIIMAFKDFNIMTSLGDSPWAGLKYFKEFFIDPSLRNTVINTLAINGLGLVFAFSAPILLAVLINELRFIRFKKIAQTVSYLPHFLSWVIFGGIIIDMLSPGGIVASFFQMIGIGGENLNIMAKGEYFYLVYTIVSIIKTVGYGSILYVAAISGIDQELYEAATVDGCNRFQKMIYVTVPCIVGTIVIMLIFQISSILNTGYEQIILLQNPMNLKFSETIDTYVYKTGVMQMRFSYATAVGVLKSGLSVMLMLMANSVSKKLLNRGLF